MQYERDGDWHKIVRVTGPKHNFLAIALSQFRRSALPKIEALGAGPARINADDVLAQVEQGVAQANTELGTSFNVRAVRYVRDDTPGKTVYRDLARNIVCRAVGDERSHKLAAG